MICWDVSGNVCSSLGYLPQEGLQNLIPTSNASWAILVNQFAKRAERGALASVCKSKDGKSVAPRHCQAQHSQPVLIVSLCERQGQSRVPQSHQTRDKLVPVVFMRSLPYALIICLSLYNTAFQQPVIGLIKIDQDCLRKHTSGHL